MSPLLVAALMLCVNGHPAPRSTHVTYGGLPAIHGLVRDHIVPLCLGGQDVASNIQYQTPADSYAKDEVERYACEAYCRSAVTLPEALHFVAHWRDAKPREKL